MASITERKNADGSKSWQAKVRRKGAPSVSRTFDLKGDAETWSREVERELQRGNVAVLRQDALRTTVADVVARYRDTALPNLRSRSAAAYITAVNERFGSLFLANVRSVDVSAWRDELLARGLAPQTVRHHINTLSALFTFTEGDLSIELPGGNPVRKVKKPPAPPSRDRRLRPGELEALQAEATTATGLREIIVLAVETSMRLGELLALRWANVNLTQRIAHLPMTKNGESRTVALSSAAIQALQALPRRLDGRVFTWTRTDSFEPIWGRLRTRARKAHVLNRLREELNQRGIDGTSEVRALVYKKRQPSPRTVALYEKIEKTDMFLHDLRFHDLRHEATSRLFEKGLGTMEVASMTGHKSLSMLKRYTHMDAAKLAQKLG